MIPIDKMFACFDSVRFFISYLGMVNLMRNEVFDFPWYTVFCREDILLGKTSFMLITRTRNFIVYTNFSFVWVLSNVVVEITRWHERHPDV